MFQVNIYKEPITDLGKMSKKGRMTLERDDDNGSFVTRTENTGDPKKVNKINEHFYMLRVLDVKCVYYFI